MNQLPKCNLLGVRLAKLGCGRPPLHTTPARELRKEDAEAGSA